MIRGGGGKPLRSHRRQCYSLSGPSSVVVLVKRYSMVGGCLVAAPIVDWSATGEKTSRQSARNQSTPMDLALPVYHENWTPMRNGPPWLGQGVHFSRVNQPMRNGPLPQFGAV